MVSENCLEAHGPRVQDALVRQEGCGLVSVNDFNLVVMLKGGSGRGERGTGRRAGRGGGGLVVVVVVMMVMMMVVVVEEEEQQKVGQKV